MHILSLKEELDDLVRKCKTVLYWKLCTRMCFGEELGGAERWLFAFLTKMSSINERMRWAALFRK